MATPKINKVCIIGASGKLAQFMVVALENDELVHEAPAIVGCQTPSALAYREVEKSLMQ